MKVILATLRALGMCRIAGLLDDDAPKQRLATSFLGLDAVVLLGVKVGRRATVEANTVVNRDLPDGVTTVGVPACIIDKRKNLP